jgi:hypothetical protein
MSHMLTKLAAAIILSAAATTASADCKSAALNCLNSNPVGLDLACASMIHSTGIASEYCRWRLNQNNNCKEIGLHCKAGGFATRNRHYVTTTGKETDGDIKDEEVCFGPNYVNKIRVAYHAGIARVAAVAITCTNGRVYRFGHAGTGAKDFTCPAGYLANGFPARSGSEVDAFGLSCRRQRDGATQTIGEPYGGTGGSYSHRTCPNGQYVYGLRVMYDGHKESNKNLIAITPICR